VPNRRHGRSGERRSTGSQVKKWTPSRGSRTPATRRPAYGSPIARDRCQTMPASSRRRAASRSAAWEGRPARRRPFPTTAVRGADRGAGAAGVVEGRVSTQTAPASVAAMATRLRARPTGRLRGGPRSASRAIRCVPRAESVRRTAPAFGEARPLGIFLPCQSLLMRAPRPTTCRRPLPTIIRTKSRTLRRPSQGRTSLRGICCRAASDAAA
jgi:hypothetical protein